MSERCKDIKPNCKYAGTLACRITVHHEFWPKRDYPTKIDKTFRQLEQNKTPLARCDHDELHLKTLPPEKPSKEHMLATIAEAVELRQVREA